MTTITNPHVLNWVNPTQATAPNGNLVTWNANTDLAGIQIDFDTQPAVSVPLSLGANSFQLSTLAAYSALTPGSHNVGISIVTVEGIVGLESNIVPFLFGPVPQAPVLSLA